MKRDNRRTALAWGEYVVPDSSQNVETASARRELMKVVHRLLPHFAAQLRREVYPNFAGLVELGRRNPQSYSGVTEGLPVDPLCVPGMAGWAQKFNAASEVWVLEGALHTLSMWHRDPELRDSLDLRWFVASCVVDTLSDGSEVMFQFEHPGWDPQFETWTSCRESMVAAFRQHLLAHEKCQRSRMESLGAVRARRLYSVENLEWFALYQLGGLSAVKILKDHPSLKGDESTILKGIKTAAELLQWKTIRRRRNLKP